MSNVEKAVPFFMVTDIEATARFYMEGLGFAMTGQWRPERAGGRLQWCSLQLGGASVMLQEYRRDMEVGGRPEGPLGQGVSVYFICADAIAIYRDVRARGLSPERPFVGNRMWVTSVTDPDGYKLFFESPTDAPEETILSD
jgi:lactoylglutathione lyase